MGLEIERKFLIKNDTWKQQASTGKTIRQGYLNLDPERTVRVRIADEHGTLPIKGKTIQTTRLEFEYDIPREEAEEILKLSDQHIIEKTRYEVQHNGKVWEIDIFKGANAGLAIAEIELSRASEEIQLPNWIGREVSEENKYYNSNLIMKPFKTWLT